MINIPTHCPSCNSTLERVNDQLFCKNNSCSAKNSKIVENFASKVKIKGLGPKAIEKLGLETVADIYDLSEHFLVDMLGVNGKKIYAEIQAKRELPLSLFLGSMSIPLIGVNTAKKISTTIDNISKDSLIKDGLGQKASNNLIEWLNTNYIPKQIQLKNEDESHFTTKGLKVCISGKFGNTTKDCLTKELNNIGVTVSNSVTKDTNYLLCANETSAKALKAKQYNIEIVKTLDELKEKIK